MYRESANYLSEFGSLDPGFIYMPGFVALLAWMKDLGGDLLAQKLIGVAFGGIGAAGLFVLSYRLLDDDRDDHGEPGWRRCARARAPRPRRCSTRCGRRASRCPASSAPTCPRRRCWRWRWRCSWRWRPATLCQRRSRSASRWGWRPGCARWRCRCRRWRWATGWRGGQNRCARWCSPRSASPRRCWCCCRGASGTCATAASSTSPTITAASRRSSARTRTPRGRTRARSTACSRTSPAAACWTSRTATPIAPRSPSRANGSRSSRVTRWGWR